MSGPVLVAEVSANHLGSQEKAIDLVRAIAAAGVRHVKFQTYTADTMTINMDGPAFCIGTDHELWGGRNLYSLYKEAHTPWEWLPDLFALSRELGMVPFSTPFDASAVDFLETLNPHYYKIASMEIGDIPLIRYVASTGRPLIISTGTATLEEVEDAVSVAQANGCTDLTLLLCTSAYPTEARDAHLARMTILRERFGLPVGLSDHTKGNAVSIAATALGAVMIERHVTMKRNEGGPDAAFSLEPSELNLLSMELSDAAAALGSSEWQTVDAEKTSRHLKRSLYIVTDCAAGEVLSPSNIRSIRPSGGLAPKYYDQILGRRLKAPASRGTPLSLDMLEAEAP